jgi:hypothetical protein
MPGSTPTETNTTEIPDDPRIFIELTDRTEKHYGPFLGHGNYSDSNVHNLTPDDNSPEESSSLTVKFLSAAAANGAGVRHETKTRDDRDRGLRSLGRPQYYDGGFTLPKYKRF